MFFIIPVNRLIRIFVALSLFLIVFGKNHIPHVRAQDARAVTLQQFDLLTASSGWIRLDQSLYWTSDAGMTLEEIGPPIPPGGSIMDVEFIDSDRGWVLWLFTNSDGSSGFQLDHTVDHGSTWKTLSLSIFEPGDIGSYVEEAHMGWFDARAGWLSVKQISGSNFSLGSLFTTVDGGNSWSASPLPVADEVFFNDLQTGWAIGGATGDRVFHTQNGGRTWENLEPSDLPAGIQGVVYPPFSSDGQGLLVMTILGEENELKVYSLDNSSARWQITDQVPLTVEPGVIGLSILDAENLVAVIPGTNSILRMVDGNLYWMENVDGHSASIVELDMVSLDVGWAKAVNSSCSPVTSSNDQAVSCTSTVHLLQTTDGGNTWITIQLPVAQGDIYPMDTGDPSVTATAIGNNLNLANTETFIGQGFDRCEIPTISQMQTWAAGSPYRTVNLYIGGSSRACDNNALTSSYLFQLRQQGWKFIPTWVGPQAPCTGFSSRISSDVDIAATQGVAQANLAVDRLAELGLTDPDKTGSVIYYDIEAYGTNQVCRDAVNAFMNGWVSQLRALGNLAGVYGSTLCNTGLSDFLNIVNVPDVIWPARWYNSPGSGYYDPNASVWNLGSCIPNTVWANHQRIRQYEGGHYETWGGLTLDIDSDVLDGVVAVLYNYPFVSSLLRADITPTNMAAVNFTVEFSKPVTGVNNADFRLITTGVTGASISSVTGSGTIYTVTVNTGTGDGTIRLDVVDNESIRDESNNPLGGFGQGNGNYASDAVYTIVKSSVFADVPAGYWSRSYIESLYNAGVTSGCNTAPLLYCPSTTVTRDQMAVFLLKGKYSSSYIPPAATGIFQDVPPDYWAADWIEQLAQEGITSGCSVGPDQYCPTTLVTRDQMAVFLMKAKYGSDYRPPDPIGMFADVPPDHWAAAWIEKLAADGITSGCSATPRNYCPGIPVTRDQMAVFLVKNFNLP